MSAPARAITAAARVLLVGAGGGCVKVGPYPVLGLEPADSSSCIGLPQGLAPIVRAVDSRQPTLRWAAPPAPGQTYDLRIWRADGAMPGDLVYSKDALPESWHTVENPLDPATLHFWTIRARRVSDGRPRVSDWAVLKMDPYGRDDRRLARIPHPGYFRFTTPGE